ncbi:hypothetical protein [Streptomyces sp. NPDC050982]|uniref:hypothetical protein n=1 Tax=Streptomyces sp. NPDC050982 TaxID=3154746 RepID=UPI0033C96363
METGDDLQATRGCSTARDGHGPARAATAMAVRDDNAVSAGHVPTVAGVTPAARTLVPSRSPG